ncbi:MAG TPA: GDSL-type esterase/lipase family protein, partial [Thermoanaerobaculia bacterium]|nr:GDSL-type esterase/lipase family protein [Thermoanaerobaculia bacterium]
TQMRRILALLLMLGGLGCGERAIINDAPPRHVVILGDSVAHGAGDESGRGLAGNLPGVTVANLGIDGARTYTVLKHLRSPRVRAAVAQADTVIVSIGGNDLFGDSRARLLSTVAPSLAMRRAGMRVERVVAAIRRENASARIYLLGLYNPYRAAWLEPHIARWDAQMIRTFADTPGVTVVRTGDVLRGKGMLSPIDRFHPSAAGYRAVAGVILRSAGAAP